MTQFEKAIKTIAIVIAVFVVIVIIGGIITAIAAIASVFSSDKAHQMFKEGANKAVEQAIELKDIDESFDASDIEDLEVNNSIGTVKIVESDDEDADEIYVTGIGLNEASCVEQNGDELYICNAAIDVELFGVKLGQKISEEDIGVTVVIPKGFEFDDVILVNSVGDLEVDCLTAESIKMESGVGDTKCRNVYAQETHINSGVGTVDVCFSGSMNDYDMNLEPGIGSIYVDGIKQSEMSHTNRDADNSIKIESGAGRVDIKFEE